MQKLQKLAELRREWYKRLKLEGFEDIEDSKYRLKNPDNRTIGFQNRGLIMDHIDGVLEWLCSEPDIPKRDKVILSLYCEGSYIKQIAKSVNLSRWTVRKVIRKYTLLKE
jgi:hypothetical protein